MEEGIIANENREIKRLVKQLEKEDVEAKKSAAIGLSHAAFRKIDITEAVPLLCKALFNNHPFVRIYASEALCEASGNGNGIADMIPHLSKAIEDDEPEVRNNVILALRNALINEHDISLAIPAVTKVLKDEDVMIRKNASSLLEKIKD